MRTKIIKQILKKEIIDILRDKKTLFMMVILPILLYPLMIIGLSQIMMVAMNSMEQKTLQIAVQGEMPTALYSEITRAEENEGKLDVIPSEDARKDLEEGNISAYIEVKQEAGKDKYVIYVNESESDSSAAGKRIEDVLERYKELLVKSEIESAGLNQESILEPIIYESVNTAKNEEMAGSLLGQLLPFILVIGVLMGCIYPAIDVMAGEKERGTLETLLTLPISNLELIIGKYLAVSLSAVVTAVLNIASIMATMGLMVGSMGMTEESFTINWGEMVLPLIITMVSVCLFAMVVAAVSMCVCSMAKNFKEAQNYITPLMLIVMLPSYVSMIPTITLTPLTASIPVVNISLLIKSVLTFKYDFGLMSIVLMSNLGLVVLSVLLLSKMFNSEEVLFGDSKSFNLLEKRSNIEKGSMPSLSDGLVVYAIALLGSIYVGTIAQAKMGLAGTVLTQALIIGVPLGVIFYIKGDFKKILRLRLPRIGSLIGGIILWAGSFIIITLLNQIILHLFPHNLEVVHQLNDVLFSEGKFWFNLFVVAILPAICEEVLFRGFLFTALSGKEKYTLGIILSSILFGLMHIDLIRILPTALLGLALVYSVYQSGSVLVSMVMHFLNNGIVVWMMHHSEGKIASYLNRITIDPNTGDGWYWILVGLILVVIGLLILKNSRKISKNLV